MDDLLSLEARKNIYEIVAKHPGLHFRELQRRSGAATGSLDYHLHFLQKHALIRKEKDSRFVRYYVTNVHLPEQKDLLSILRQRHVRHILIYLAQEKNPTATMIAQAVGISPSNLSWYLKALQDKNLIVQRKKGRFRYYRINKEFTDDIVRCLIAHKESFLDSMVDSFIEAWTLE